MKLIKYILYYSQAIESPWCFQLYPSVFSKDLLGREAGGELGREEEGTPHQLQL